MKKLLFSIFFAAGFMFLNHTIAQCHFSTKIGELVNGNAVITYDMATLKSELSSFLYSQSSISVTFTNATIELDGNSYLLVASNEDSTIKTAVGLVIDGNSFYQEVSAVQNGGTTCTCTGCTEGCNPYKGSNGLWYCDSCSLLPNNCTKSVTASGIAIFGGIRN
jgi:hypothetical protein